jgi:DNA-damage-inducible protein J
MANTATIAVRINPVIKRSANEVVKQYGLDLATAVRMFVTQISRERRVPVDISTSVDTTLTGEEYLNHVKKSLAQLDNGEWAYHELIEA